MPDTATAPEQAELKQPTTTVETEVKAAAPKKRRVKRTVAAGQVHIQATFNNTIVTITDIKGNVLTSSSAGACGFRGSKKGTAYAAQIASEKAANDARQLYGLSKVDVFVNGVGQGRDAAMRALQNVDIFVDSIKDETTVPHGGCRPRRARRV